MSTESFYDKILVDACQKNDVDIKLVKEIIRLNEVSDIQSADEQLNRKKQIIKILDKHIKDSE